MLGPFNLGPFNLGPFNLGPFNLVTFNLVTGPAPNLVTGPATREMERRPWPVPPQIYGDRFGADQIWGDTSRSALLYSALLRSIAPLDIPGFPRQSVPRSRRDPAPPIGKQLAHPDIAGGTHHPHAQRVKARIDNISAV